MTRRVTTVLLLALASTALGVLVAVSLFLDGSRTIVLAGHDAVVRPTLGSDAVVQTGPLLPDLRVRDVGPVGVSISLGKTEVASVEELVERYAFIASEPDSQIAKVERAVRDIAVSAAIRGVAVGLLPVVAWLLLGPHRRGELFRGVRSRRGVVAAALLLVVPVLVWQPWDISDETQAEQGSWVPLQTFVGDAVSLPPELDRIELLTTTTTKQTRRLLLSAVSTYEKSKEFYSTAAEAAADLEVRQPREGESVALLVSDRHDNIGMDPVARAIGEAGGAEVVLDAGDDTSTGQPWEAFSLDSLNRTFEDWERFGVAGNHDNGTFVPRYLADRGWTMLDGEPVEAPWGGLLLGVNDPRSSGLGNWRDESGLSFAEVGDRLADEACRVMEDNADDAQSETETESDEEAADDAGEDAQETPSRDADPKQEGPERVSVVLVHDANLGRETLARGCADLVVGGHTHVQSGPDPVLGENGRLGWTWTTGTTGGAAYAIAVGSKPRRDAEVTLITFDDETGRPVGLQSVRLRTDGRFLVAPFSPLDPALAARPRVGPRSVDPDAVNPDAVDPDAVDPDGTESSE